MICRSWLSYLLLPPPSAATLSTCLVPLGAAEQRGFGLKTSKEKTALKLHRNSYLCSLAVVFALRQGDSGLSSHVEAAEHDQCRQ